MVEDGAVPPQCIFRRGAALVLEEGEVVAARVDGRPGAFDLQVLAEGPAAVQVLSDLQFQPLAPGNVLQHGVRMADIREGIADTQDTDLAGCLRAVGNGKLLAESRTAEGQSEKEEEKSFHHHAV